MTSQAFFWVNVGLGLFLVLIFVLGKRGLVAPSQLNLKKNLMGRGLVSRGATFRTSTPGIFHEPMPEKSLNIFFVYNGHAFEAYEVLGLPAGANFEVVTRTFSERVSRGGQDRDFIEAAYLAIKNSDGRA